MSEAVHNLVVTYVERVGDPRCEYEYQIAHPGCDPIPDEDKHWQPAARCGVQWELDNIGSAALAEAFKDQDTPWPPPPGVYRIEFWHQWYSIPWVGLEHDTGLRLVD